MSSLLSIGLTGLNAAQTALTTTGHNIANANVAGYNRQKVVQGTSDPLYTGVGFVGQGTRIETITRVYSQFLDNQVMTADSSRAELDSYHGEITQIDNLLANETSGLSPSLQSFFSGIQDLAANPASIPSRQSTLSSAQALVTRFHSLYERMGQIRDGVESQIQGSVSNVNSLADQISQLNARIVAAQVGGAASPANDLQDQRGNLVAELNREVRVSTVAQDDGSINLFIGTGQPLVIGVNAYTLTTSPSVNDAQRLGIGLLLPSGASVPIPESLISGGNLGGLLRFRSEALDPAQNALGRVAVGITQTVNAQHQLGQDLNGVMGGNFFTPLTPTVQNLPDPTTGLPPTATISAAYGTVANLTSEDYILSYDGTNYAMRRQSDSNVVYSGATLPSNVDGITVSLVSGTIAAGDRFLIQPTRFGAQNVNVAIQDPRLLAAAAPFRTSAASSNSGAGTISQGSAVSLTGISATAPHLANIALTFDSTTNLFTLSGGAAGTLAYNPVADAAGKTFTLATPNISFSISGVPTTGDVFNITSNASGVSDNRNALAIGSLQSLKTLIGGGANFQSAYSQLVGDVGFRTREAQVGMEAQQGLLDQATATQQSLSGVSLDEEASNLVRFQQAYQASARVMSMAGKLFDEILAIAR